MSERELRDPSTWREIINSDELFDECNARRWHVEVQSSGYYSSHRCRLLARVDLDKDVDDDGDSRGPIKTLNASTEVQFEAATVRNALLGAMEVAQQFTERLELFSVGRETLALGREDGY